MSFLNKKDKEHNTPITIGRISQVPQKDKDIYITVQRTYNLLKKIACEPNKFKAIDIIITEHPDGKQAYNNFLRLANQGLSIELYNRNTGRRVKKYDNECRAFCAKMGVNNSEGLDGLVDQLHGSSVAHGGMACEIVVNADATDVEDVVLVDPATFYEYKWIEDENRYAIFQQRDDGKKIDLYEGNFLYIPYQPPIGRPEGTLSFLPAVIAVTWQLQLIEDFWRFSNRVGTPRYLSTMDVEAMLNSVPMNQKDTVRKQNEVIQANMNFMEEQLRRIGKDSDIITTSVNKVEVIGGGDKGSGIDVRAWFEVLEPLIVNSFNMTPVLMGRLKSGSYSLGTVEFKIVTDTVDSMRRGSKRIIEEIVNVWARVKGYNVYAVVTHNPINWEVQKEKLETELLKMQKARRAEEYRWIDHDTAAMEGAGAEKAPDDKNKDMFEYLTKDFREKETEEVVKETDKNEEKEEKSE